MISVISKEGNISASCFQQHFGGVLDTENAINTKALIDSITSLNSDFLSKESYHQCNRVSHDIYNNLLSWSQE